jgi:hypothetical protein
MIFALLLCCVCALFGCGGSGSSGFDGEPATGEPDALARAVADVDCVPFENVTYCGSGAPFEVTPDFATVEIQEPSTPIPCTQSSSENVCEASVTFTPIGFAAGTAYFVASAGSFDGPWTLSNDVPAPSTGGPPEDRPAAVELPSEGAGGAPPPSPVVIAVLVYLTSPPAELPSETLLLSDLAPDVVYASRELDVAPTP